MILTERQLCSKPGVEDVGAVEVADGPIPGEIWNGIEQRNAIIVRCFVNRFAVSVRCRQQDSVFEWVLQVKLQSAVVRCAERHELLSLGVPPKGRVQRLTCCAEPRRLACVGF